jgi:hypothetical protein
MSNTQQLPFTSQSDDLDASLIRTGKRFWTVTPSGNWIEDCKLGEEYARLYLERINTGSSTPLMCWIVADMIKAGRYTGVECGFIQAVSRRP